MEFIPIEKYHGTQVFRDIMQVQIDLLKRFIRLCEEHDIRYYAVCGTLLGAVRHGGCIPWDDDIDVAIWRKDAEKLYRAAETLEKPYGFVRSDDLNNYNANVIQFVNMETTYTPVWDFKAGVVAAIHIDVDIIDYTFGGEEKRKVKNALLERAYITRNHQCYGDWHWMYRFQPEKSRRRYYAVSHAFRASTLQRMEQKLHGWHGLSKKYCSIYTYKQYPLFRSAWFASTLQMSFGDMQIAVPGGYHEILQELYGENYMLLPPKASRQPVHLRYMYVNPYVGYRQTLVRFLRFLNNSSRDTVLWGAGQMTRHYLERFGKDYPARWIVDRSPNRAAELEGIPVISPEELQQMDPHKVHIIVCNIYAPEVILQLHEMGEYPYTVYWEEYWNQHPLPQDCSSIEYYSE